MEGTAENKTGFIPRTIFGAGRMIEVMTSIQILYSEVIAFSTNDDLAPARMSFSVNSSIEECSRDIIIIGKYLAIKICIRVYFCPHNNHYKETQSL